MDFGKIHLLRAPPHRVSRLVIPEITTVLLNPTFILTCSFVDFHIANCYWWNHGVAKSYILNDCIVKIEL